MRKATMIAMVVAAFLVTGVCQAEELLSDAEMAATLGAGNGKKCTVNRCNGTNSYCGGMAPCLPTFYRLWFPRNGCVAGRPCDYCAINGPNVDCSQMASCSPHPTLQNCIKGTSTFDKVKNATCVSG